MNRSAVVFGASGLVGSELVSELVLNDDYEKVTVVVRRNYPLQNPKLKQVLLTDFSTLHHQKDNLKATDYFCCLGTTIKKAGTQEAFRKVDFNIPLHIAQLAQDLGVPNLVVISSIGANARTGNFYLRTKGEMELAVKQTYAGNLKFVRPSLLMGNRKEYRFGERAGTVFMNLMGWIFIGPMKKYKGIHARDVAKAMIRATRLPVDKLVLESDELHN